MFLVFFWGGGRLRRFFFSGACLLYCFWSVFAPVGFKNVVRNVFFPACLHVRPVVSLDCLCVPQPFRNFRWCVRPVFTLDSCREMAAAVAGASGGSGGAGGGSDPPYPWRKPEVMDNLPPPPSEPEEEEDESDLANFSRRKCQKCGKMEYLRKGGCANPSCVSRHNN